MCDFCEGHRGKTILSITKGLADSHPYSGGYYKSRRTFEVKIIRSKRGIELAIGSHNFDPFYDEIEDKIKIKYCPMCGSELKDETITPSTEERT